MEEKFGIDVIGYMAKAWQAVHPAWVAFISLVNYVLFPDDAFIPAAISLIISMILDIVTKYYAVKHSNKCTWFECFKSRKLSSNQLWFGSRKKIISYLIIMILAGLSVRVTMLTDVAVFLSTIAYSVMFLRESQSVVENLIDAGHDDLKWLLFWLKRKESRVLESQDVEIESKNYEDRV